MLIKGILEEQFVSTKIKGIPTCNVSVYLVLGKKHKILTDKKILLTLTMGVNANEELDFDEQNEVVEKPLLF